jgi:DNA-binding CsgD family transcriptional regulator
MAVVQLGPLPLSGLHALLSERLGRALPRPTMTRIHRISGGNPFFAMELARTIGVDPSAEHQELSPTLAELMRQRTRHVGEVDGDVLLAAACMTDPTIDVLAAATSRSVDEVVESLEAAEAESIVHIEGNRVRFDHPLLARGVYTQASTAERRRMHKTLAGVEAHVEVKARHLALAAATADADTLLALDGAADAAAARGAPAAAAELFELGIGLGGDDPVRRFRAAACLLTSGDTVRSRVVLEPAIAAMEPGTLRASALNLLAGLCVYTDGFGEATDCLLTALRETGDSRLLRVHTLLMLAFAQVNDGDFAGSLHHASLAVAEAEELGVAALTSQVLSMWVMVSCICGNGVDDGARQRALDLEDRELNAPIVFRAHANNAQLLAWKGDLDGAKAQMAEVRRRCEERGAESDLMFVYTQSALFEIWRGDFTEAAAVADEALERAEQLGGDNSILGALTVQTAVAAYTGREQVARQMSTRALDTAARCGARRTAEVTTTMLAFLEVSLGRHAEALRVLDSTIGTFSNTPTGTEILTAMFIPDAVEAWVILGRAEEAEPLTAALEANGARLNRPWMLAVGARCRALILADRGELDAAERVARRAMLEHDRLPMPFEKARTQLLLGQILRRRRQRQAAIDCCAEALAAFERIGTPLWAARARADLNRLRGTSAGTSALTPAERRVAERAAEGMSNREIAAELFISVKTVETSLSSAYRKLGIRSRSQLFSSLTP